MSGFNTRAIHAGQEPDPLTGAVTVPIYATSTYKQDGVGGLRGGYEYSRSANPTRTALEEALAALEGGRRGLAFASGMAAEDTLLRAICRPGDHVMLPDDAYGGTFRLVARVLARWGLEYTTVPLVDLDAVRAAVRPTTRVLWAETPTNPLLGIADIAALASVAARSRSPARRRQHLRLALSAAADRAGRRRRRALDDQVPGRALGRHRRRARYRGRRARRPARVPPERDGRGRRTVRRLAGAARHQDAGRADGSALRECRTHRRVPAGPPGCRPCALPGAGRPPRSRRSRPVRCARFGGMVSFTLRGGEEAALKVCELASVFTLGESLGGVESLIEHPGRMTHASASPARRWRCPTTSSGSRSVSRTSTT